MLRLSCPCCGSRLHAEEQLVGQTLRCPKCLSPVVVKRPSPEQLAPIVEASYEPKVYEEDIPHDTSCPKCEVQIAAGETLCRKCGWHLRLEAYFEDLTEDALAVDRQPKTREEKWLEEHLHEIATPRDVLIVSALCASVLCVLYVVVGRIAIGPWGGTAFGLLASAATWYGWLITMRRLGILEDPRRAQRLARQGKSQGSALPKSAVQPARQKQTPPAVSSAPANDRAEDRSSTPPAADITLSDETTRAPEKTSPTGQTSGQATTPAARDRALTEDTAWLDDLL